MPHVDNVARSETEINQSTEAMLQALRAAKSIPCDELLRLIDEHASDSEKYYSTLEPAWSKVRTLTANLRSDLRVSGIRSQAPTDAGSSGIFGDILSTFGLDAGPTPDHCEASLTGPAMSLFSESSEQATDLGKALEHLEHQPARALKDARRVEAEVKEMLRVLERVKPCWADFRSSVERAYKGRTQLKTGDISKALKQILQLRERYPSIIRSIDDLCDLLEDATDQVRRREEERLRFKTMTRDILDGQSSSLAARTVAVLWLRQLGKAGSSNARPTHLTRFDMEQASEALERNLEAAKDMDSRLVRGAGSVLKRETNHQVVQRAVAKLSALRSRVQAAAEAVAAARLDLASANKCNQLAVTEAAAAALQQLMAAFDEAASHVDAGGGRGSTSQEVRDPIMQVPSTTALESALAGRQTATGKCADASVS